jgi:hypothetical protein
MNRPALLALLLASSGGCSLLDALQGTGSQATRPPEPKHAFMGSQIDTFVDESGNQADVPVDLSQVSIRAHVETGDAFSVIDGKGSADGQFSIDVPDGPFLLQVGTNYYATSSGVKGLDLGRTLGGLPRAAQATTPTMLKLELDMMSPWEEGHRLDIVVPQTGVWGYVSPGSMNDPVVGDVTLAATMDWAAQAFPPVLVDAARGDRPVVIQLVFATTPSGLRYQRAQNYAPLSFSQSDGGFTQARGSFSSMDDSILRGLSWRRSVSEMLRRDVHPQAVVNRQTVLVHMSHFPPIGQIASTADLFIAEADGTQSFDVTLDGAIMGMLPSSQGEGTVMLRHDISLAVPYPIPGFDTKSVEAVISTNVIGIPSVAEPLLGPPRSLLVDGQPPQPTVVAISTSPTVTWNSPSLGAAGGYAVGVLELVPAGQPLVSVATFFTTQTRMRIPPGIFASGKRYFVRVTSRFVEGVDLATQPHRRSPRIAVADALTSALEIAGAGQGCADGSREGFLEVPAFPNIAACRGSWNGAISDPSARAICVSGWHLCTHLDTGILREISFQQATAFTGCFAFDAAPDGGSCLPCTGAGGSQNDMGGVGSGCGSKIEGSSSCLGSGRIDVVENQRNSCSFQEGVTDGVVCCKDIAP